MKLSVCVTTFNAADTLPELLASVVFADEILILDSGSTDHTLALARAAGARIVEEPFKGYAEQKASAVARCQHDWVLLLDHDEALSEAAPEAIRAALATPGDRVGFTLPRIEWMFWRFAHQRTRHNRFLRLFRRDRVRFSPEVIHAAPKVDGPVGRIEAPFLHRGERNIETKVNKINQWSSAMVAETLARPRLLGLRLVFYPPLYFLRLYLFKRQFLNGWAGFISSAVGAFYAFLKLAKALESRRPR